MPDKLTKIYKTMTAPKADYKKLSWAGTALNRGGVCCQPRPKDIYNLFKNEFKYHYVDAFSPKPMVFRGGSFSVRKQKAFSGWSESVVVWDSGNYSRAISKNVVLRGEEYVISAIRDSNFGVYNLFGLEPDYSFKLYRGDDIVACADGTTFKISNSNEVESLILLQTALFIATGLSFCREKTVIEKMLEDSKSRQLIL